MPASALRPQPAQAVVICTRNRPADLARTLESIAAQGAAGDGPVLVVDASDEAAFAQNAARLGALTAPPVRHLRFPGAPSLARQRNFGVDHLPPSVQVVHFLDDDVTLQPGYFHHLAARLAGDPSLGGVGGRIVEPGAGDRGAGPGSRLARRLFLLDHPRPGRVLASGATTPAQILDLKHPADVEWLSGCCCTYRRALLDRHRFDPALEGYAMDEDLDLSYRIGREARLAVEPRAVLLHHRAPANRYDTRRMACVALVHRYWFVRKNLRQPLARAAFWWSTLGRLLAVRRSRRPEAAAVLQGLLDGVRIIRSRAHPLLARN